jgi:CIC family chloride channel protein
MRGAVDRLTRRARFAVALIAAAIGASLFAVSFRSLLSLVYGHAYHSANVVEAIARLPWWLRLIVPMIGATTAGVLVRVRGAQGVSNVMEAVALGNVRLSVRTTLCRVAASWVAIGAGMSIGREGPLIEFGGTLGDTLGRSVGTTLRQRRVLVAAGTAAGFASAYNTPFAAILFVFETIVGVAAPEALLPTIAATVIATTITRSLAGAGPIYGQRSFASQSPIDLVWFTLLGLLAAAAGFGF